jgi:hypothetical protein
MIFEYFGVKKLGNFLLKLLLLGFEKNDNNIVFAKFINLFAENWRESKKILIITLTHDSEAG